MEGAPSILLSIFLMGFLLLFGVDAGMFSPGHVPLEGPVEKMVGKQGPSIKKLLVRRTTCKSLDKHLDGGKTLKCKVPSTADVTRRYLQT